MSYIGRSNINRLHRCIDGGRTFCNRVPGLPNCPVSDLTVKTVGESAFCRKCFPGGKADALVIIEEGNP